MAIGGINVGQELMNVPMGTMIREMAKAIADAQWELDKSSMTVAEMMSGQRVLRDLDSGQLVNPYPDGAPRILDSRVYFGYTYLQEAEGSGNTPAKWRRVPNKVSMMELGFTPTFYQFVDTIIEVKIAIKITGETVNTTSSAQASQTAENVNQDRNDYSYSGSWGWWGGYNGNSSWANTKTQRNTVQTAQVDASYSNKYSYSVEGSSLLRTKLAPVPPPAILMERIQEVMEMERDFQTRVQANEVELLTTAK